MAGDIFYDIMKEHGFRQIGQLQHQLTLSLWWHEEHKLQVMLCTLGSGALLKGSKSYFMETITPEGETHARDIGHLQDYLEAHFPEMHLSFSFFRDITKSLAAKHIQKRATAVTPTVHYPSVDDLATLQQQLNDTKSHIRSGRTILDMSTDEGSLMQTHLTKCQTELQRQATVQQEQVQAATERQSVFNHLQREYERKGSAAVFTFTINSNSQIVDRVESFSDALSSIVKDLTDLHRYQVNQKLGGGRLNIHVVESDEPLMVWIEQWLGGGLSPRQIQGLPESWQMLRDSSEKHMMVTPGSDIVADGHIKEDRKRLAARVVSTLTRRLDSTDGLLIQGEVSTDELPLRVGRIMRGEHATGDDFLLPLSKLKHAYISGATGSGKSYFGRVLVEEAAQYNQLSILILDPRNQAAGLLVPEDRSSILDKYADFNMKKEQARGFAFDYFAPKLAGIKELPQYLRGLGTGRTIVSFKALDDAKRCNLFADILDAVFKQCSDSESESTRLFIVIEEAQRFTKKRIDQNAKSAGARAENALDRTVREGRKFGICVAILSQTIRDFAYDSASIRQNTNTKVFFHNSDREVDYAANFIGDGKQIIQLQPATAILHNAHFGTAKIKVRPPYSKVWEYSNQETLQLLGNSTLSGVTVSAPARTLLHHIHTLHSKHGDAPNVTELGDVSGVTSKRLLQSLLQELEQAGLIRSKRLQQQGRPRVIEIIPSSTPTLDTTPDSNRTETDQKK